MWNDECCLLFAYGSITSALPRLNAAVKYFSISKLEKVKKRRENYTKLPLCFICLFIIRSCCGKNHNRVISFQILYVIWNSTENLKQSWSQSNCLQSTAAVWCAWVNLSNFFGDILKRMSQRVLKAVNPAFCFVMDFIFCNSALLYWSSHLFIP